MKYNYKMTSQYKWFHNRFFFHLFAAGVWLIVILLIFLFTIFDDKKLAFAFLICGCLLVILFFDPILIYYGMKLAKITKDKYQIKEVKVVNVYEISSRKIQITILTDAKENEEIIIYKIFLDPAISLMQDSKLNVLVGNSNILI